MFESKKLGAMQNGKPKMKNKITLVACFFLAIAICGTPSAFADKPEDLLNTGRNYENVRVEKVLSADSFILEGGQKIRLIGLNALPAPKRQQIKTDEYGIIVKEVNPVSTLIEQAFDFAKDLLENKYVRLELDAEQRDEKFKTLAYAFLSDGTFVNAEILRQGFANLKLSPLNKKYTEQLRRAYQEAREQKRGLQGE